MTIKTRIILILTSVFIFYTLLYSGFIYYSISKYSYEDFYKRLELRAVTTAKIELDEQKKEINTFKEFRIGYLEQLPDERSYIFELNEKEINRNLKKHKLPRILIDEIVKNKIAKSRVDNTFYAGVIYSVDESDYISIVSATNYYSSHHNVYLKNLLLISLLIALIIIFLTAYFLTKKILAPIEYITNRVKNISTENMHLRLNEGKANDELGVLITTFNDMLNRLETSFETQKNFISNASHELNTPLTTILGEADLALSKIRTTDEYIEALSAILEEAENLDKKTKALLFLAQTGYNGKVLKFDKVRVDQLIIDVKTTVVKIYPQAKLNIDFSLLPESPEKLKVKGNEQLLHLAFSNIIMNACKYSNNKEVRISVGSTLKEVVVTIKDYGIGIPANEMQYIYDPFFRASNTRQFDGYGIGLPLARNVIRIHGGELIVESKKDKGTLVEVRLPIGNYSI